MARDLKQLVGDVKKARAEFEARLDDMDVAKERYYETVRRLYKAGMPLREIAEAVGVSHQRVHQIVGEEPTRSRVRRAVAKRARAGGAALVLVLAASLWASSSGEPQPRAEALAELEDARNFMATRLPDEAREFIVPKLDRLGDQADR
jgi:predicted transcriptional regulator